MEDALRNKREAEAELNLKLEAHRAEEAALRQQIEQMKLTEKELNEKMEREIE